MTKYKFIFMRLTLVFIAVICVIGCTDLPASNAETMSCGSFMKLDFSNASVEEISVKMGDKTFVPLNSVSKSLGLKLETLKNGEFKLSSGNGVITGKAGSTEVMVDDKKKYLPLPVMKIENQIFVPDQFIEQCL